MFDLCHHALAVYADIDNCYGMSHMEVVKKFERKKQKKKLSSYSITNAYKSTKKKEERNQQA